MIRQHIALYSLLILLACLCLALALRSGPFPLSLTQIGQLLIAPDSVDPRLQLVFWHVRLPRIVAALLIGASLSVAGATCQGMFRNPLVSPDILGVSAGAGLGASLALLLGYSLWWVQLLAFTGGLLTVALVYGISRLATRVDPVLSLVLIGMALATLCGAGISLIKILADPYRQLPEITFWLLGSLAAISRHDVLLAAPWMLVGLLPLLLLRWRMNLLSLDDDDARALGIPLTRLRLIMVVAATLMTASAVAIAGIIGWLGLVVPHICRLLTGASYQRLLPLSAFIGGLLLLLTDTLARSISNTELPLGILTALIGAPFFLLLLLRGKAL